MINEGSLYLLPQSTGKASRAVRATNRVLGINGFAVPLEELGGSGFTSQST